MNLYNSAALMVAYKTLLCLHCDVLLVSLSHVCWTTVLSVSFTRWKDIWVGLSSYSRLNLFSVASFIFLSLDRFEKCLLSTDYVSGHLEHQLSSVMITNYDSIMNQCPRLAFPPCYVFYFTTIALNNICNHGVCVCVRERERERERERGRIVLYD
jgi:hypothetical protein